MRAAKMSLAGLPLAHMSSANPLKAELKRKGVPYAQLVEKLAEIGVDEKETNVKNKLSRSKFTAAFFLQCLGAIGVQDLRSG